MEASSTVLHLIATQSAGIFIVLVVFVSYTIPFWKKKKNHSDLSKSTSAHLYCSY